MWIWFFCLLLALIAIRPNFEKGVIIKSVEEGSSAALAGMSRGEIIKEINGVKISNVADYSQVAYPNIKDTNFSIKTKTGTFSFSSKELGIKVENRTIINVSDAARDAGLKEGMLVLEINNKKIANDEDFYEAKTLFEPKEKFEIKTNKKSYTLMLNKPLDISVGEVPRTRIKTGLDITGGSRALVRPERTLSQQEMSDLLAVSRYRLNVYGVTDINIREARDIQGNQYMLVELAGATPAELRDLIAKQGKFEAKIGNETVFVGGKADITSVCRNDATCAGIESCTELQEGAACRFRFVVYLSEAAAKRHAEITSNLSINYTQQGNYLSKTLDLYLDDKLVDSLLISSDLQGKVTTQVQVEGSGIGSDKAKAFDAAQQNMQKLQTILITGSLPFKLEIVKLDSISPMLGKKFVMNILIASLVAIIVVATVLFIRYRKIKPPLLIMACMLSEIFITLGVAALIKWNLDQASIAGIIAAIGTGVDDQIVILDETRTGEQLSQKERIKRAFAIILGAYSTTFVSLLPLFRAGAGLLKGFALTTIIGITIGVFITRPAYSDIISRIEK